jgi:hypothetical protein
MTEEMRMSKKVAVDWHNTLECYGSVSKKNIQALQLLLEKGFEISILSFAGAKRASDVHALAKELEKHVTFRRVRCIDTRVGVGGKVDECFRLKIGTLFDDNEEIVKEARRFNMRVFAINTKWQKHGYLEKGERSYDTFAQAVDYFLLQQEETF